MEDTEKRVAYSFSQICDQMTWVEERYLRKGQFSDITAKELRVVIVIAQLESATARHVADRLHLTPGTLTVTINRLNEKGYTTRTRDDSDRRVVMIRLTVRGRKLYRAHREFQREMLELVMPEMPTSYQASLANGLERLSAKIVALGK